MARTIGLVPMATLIMSLAALFHADHDVKFMIDARLGRGWGEGEGGVVAELVVGAARIPVPGGKVIDEYIGRVNTGESAVSVAHMVAPGGWVEPAQRPEFDEFTLVLKGCLRVEHPGGVFDVRAGQAVVTRAGERVRYTTPDPDGAEYVAVCLPAFQPDTAGREE
jgi:mannose-6-phosphate isomerase-like protein (cupin superfamily)